MDINITDKVGVHVIGLSYSSAAIEHRRDSNVANDVAQTRDNALKGFETTLSIV